MPKEPSYKRFRVRSRVDELPPEAREMIDEMLASQVPYYTYQDIVDALAETGQTIAKSSISRYVSRKNEAAREVNMVVRQTDALLNWMRDNPNFDIAGASLALLTGRLSNRLITEPEMINELSPDKAAARIIQAARTSAQFEKIAQSGENKKAAARVAVMDELREALHSEPELFSRLQELVAYKAEQEGGAG